jgi:hypothetical protein
MHLQVIYLSTNEQVVRKNPEIKMSKCSRGVEGTENSRSAWLNKTTRKSQGIRNENAIKDGSEIGRAIAQVQDRHTKSKACRGRSYM